MRGDRFGEMFDGYTRGVIDKVAEVRAEALRTIISEAEKRFEFDFGGESMNDDERAFCSEIAADHLETRDPVSGETLYNVASAIYTNFLSEYYPDVGGEKLSERKVSGSDSPEGRRILLGKYRRARDLNHQGVA